MEWRDEAIVIEARRHGESAVVLTVLSRSHGRHAGLVPGGQSRRLRAIMQPGTHLDVTWRARLADHLGVFSVEAEAEVDFAIVEDPFRLAALQSAAALLTATLGEREANPGIFEATSALMELLSSPHWAPAYVQWEVGLLRALGFGLDLEACGATGSAENLIYVSPRTGRAISAGPGEPYKDRLLPLPGFLVGGSRVSEKDIVDGLTLTGYFLEHHVFGQGTSTMPPARYRLMDRMARRTDTSPEPPDATG